MVRELHITPVLNGFVVKVGCQTVVFRDVESLGEAITKYYHNPKLIEENYIKFAVNKMMGNPAQPTEPIYSDGQPETGCNSLPERLL
jgi:hypothetical protein